MLRAEFLSGGNSLEQAMEFTCKLVSSIFIGEQKNISLGSNIHIRCESPIDAQIIDERMWESPKEMIIIHNISNQDNKACPIQISYPGLKVDDQLFNTLVNLNPDLPKDLINYKNLFQIVIEDGGDLRKRAAESWKNCLKLNIETKFKS